MPNKPKPYNNQARLEKAIRSILEGRIGTEKSITGEALTNHLNLYGFATLTQRQLRYAIRDIRRQGIPICSKAGRGYFWPRTLEDVQKCQAVEFESKALDMLKTGKAMMDGAVALFGNQGRMGL